MKDLHFNKTFYTTTIFVLASLFFALVYVAGSFLNSKTIPATSSSVIDDVLKTRIEYEASNLTSSSISQQNYEEDYIRFVQYDLDEQRNLVNPTHLSIQKKYEKYQKDIDLQQELWKHFQTIAPQQEEANIHDVVFLAMVNLDQLHIPIGMMKQR